METTIFILTLLTINVLRVNTLECYVCNDCSVIKDSYLQSCPLPETSTIGTTANPTTVISSSSTSAATSGPNPTTSATGSSTEASTGGTVVTDTSTDTSTGGSSATDSSTETSTGGTVVTEISTETSTEGAPATVSSTEASNGGAVVTETSTEISTEGASGTVTSTEASPGGAVVADPSSDTPTDESSASDSSIVAPPGGATDTSSDTSIDETSPAETVNVKGNNRRKRSITSIFKQKIPSCVCEAGLPCECRNSLLARATQYSCVVENNNGKINRGCAEVKSEEKLTCTGVGFLESCKVCNTDKCNFAVTARYSVALLLSVIILVFTH